jgi:hypothetical protein
LKAIYGSDQSPTKAADVAKLAAAYRSFGPLVDRSPTTGDLFAETARIGRAAVPLPALLSLREKIAEFLNQQLGNESVPLTPELRAKTHAAFDRIAGILESLK